MNLRTVGRAFFLTTFFLFLFFHGGTGIVHAGSANACHCFKDRAYDPADRFAADEYILATSFNSLLANFYSLPKRKIIMVKMKQGVDQNDLLVALKVARVARAAGADLDHLLGLRRQNHGWPDILKNLGNEGTIGTDPLLENIRSGIPVELAGAAVADEMLSEFYGVPGNGIRELRALGLNEKEMALVYILAHVSGQEPEKVVDKKMSANKSWSELAHDFGVTPEAAGKLIINYPDGPQR